MGEVDFNRTTEDEKIDPEKKYTIPNKRPSCVSAKNGMFCYCLSSGMTGSFYHSINHRRFWDIPKGAKTWQLPEYRWREKSGHHYGKMVWGF
jgi:hypothetical protein